MPTRMPRIAQLAATVLLAAGAFALAEQPAPVTVVRVQTTAVRLPAGFCELAGLTPDKQPKGGPCQDVLTAREAKLLEALVEAQPGKEYISRPGFRLLDGQLGRVTSGQSVTVVTGLQPAAGKEANAYHLKTEVMDVGIELQLTPKLSTDGKFIRLDAELTRSWLSDQSVQIPVTGGEEEAPRTVTIFPASGMPSRNTQRIHTAVSLPEGGTAVIAWPSSAADGKAPSELVWILTASVEKPAPAK